jgi:hypothetical protein
MANVSDYIGQSYQRYSLGARFTVPPDAKPPYDPGLVESDQGVVFYLHPDGELVDVAGSGSVRGGLASLRTDGNGQATVVFPEPFAAVPSAILTTPKNNLVAVGTLVLTESQVTVWVWDLPSGAWFANANVDLYWLGLF